MRIADIEAVSEVEAAAFAYLADPASEIPKGLPKRNKAYIHAALWKDPDGCFVIEDDDTQIGGAVFSTTWGGVGWFGYLSIRPDLQSQGLGKRLVAQSLAYLCQDSSRIVGLETSVGRADNIGFYARQGFELRRVTVFLKRSIGSIETDHSKIEARPWSTLTRGERALWLRSLRQIAGELGPGLDYSKEVLACDQFGLGETLCFVVDSECQGFATIHTLPRRGLADEPGYLHILALHPRITADADLQRILEKIEDYCVREGKQELQLVVNSIYHPALQAVVGRGYRVTRLMLRMTCSGMKDACLSQNHVNMATWSG